MSHKTPTNTALAYSYIRFSHPDQAKGDSLRRQKDLRQDWLCRSNVTLDTSLSLEDHGVSAYQGNHRDNPDRHALAAFLQLVEQGRIPHGSYLIVESLDRLSREDAVPALTLLLNLIQAGIRVVQLLPAEVIYDANTNPMQLMMAIMELSRGHSESAMKSERGTRTWQHKKRLASQGIPLTARCPAWLRLVNGRWEVIESAANLVGLIYRLAIEGHGEKFITKRLNAEKVPTICRTTWWAKGSVAKLLANEAVIGVYQPFTGRGKTRRPDGPPIPGYFPRIITQEVWDAARGAIASRTHKGGRLSLMHINVFANLLRDARDGASLHQRDHGQRKNGRTLISSKAIHGVTGSRYVSFPFATLESAILSCLREIDPREILPHNHAADKTLVLAGQLTQLETRIARLKTKLRTDDNIDPIVDVLRELEAERQPLVQALAHARQEAAAPLAANWTDCQNLVQILTKAPNPLETRIKLRSAIRRIVEGIWCLFIPLGHNRLAAVQIWFTGGAHRDYLILHQRAINRFGSTRPAHWTVRSLVTTTTPGDLDLRMPEHVAALENALTAMPLDPPT